MRSAASAALEAQIAGKQLVAAVAGEHDRHVLRVSCETRYVGIADESPNGPS